MGKMSKRAKELNQYFTPPGPVVLLREYLMDGVYFGQSRNVFEPCAGDGGIADVFDNYGHDVVTNDVDPRMGADITSDFVRGEAEYPEADWIITNPPFTTADYKASDFVKQALRMRPDGGVAFLVRSSFLEPCRDRKKLLKRRPPNDILILPRISFSRDGKTDSANYHWLIWYTETPIGKVRSVEWYDRKDVKAYRKQYYGEFPHARAESEET